MISAVDELSFESLQLCELSSLEIFNLPSTENIEPCIIHHVDPNATETYNATASGPYDLIVTGLMVTASNCHDHRDGSMVAMEKLNADNNGKGFAIGFSKDFYVGFQLISVIAGNPAFLGNAAYDALHKHLLNTMLEATTGQFRFIIGTCSQKASIEKEFALAHETILIAQVGPPSFYNPSENPWVFGFHVTSDDYTAASIRKLRFMAETQPGGVARQPVRVIYNTRSEFFFSTCATALRMLEEAGFSDVVSVLYDPFEDDDGDGIENYRDYQTMTKVVDEICPPGSANRTDVPPALYMCTLTEQDLILPRLRENHCLLTSLWMTPATWGWALQNQKQVPYVQGAGQWHSAFQYSDEYFDSGIEMLESNVPKVGYLGGYDMLVSYAIPVFYARFLHIVYRVYNNPDPLGDVSTPEGREQLRRIMLNIRVDTIFGTVQFDDKQRNNGRESAAIQWQSRPYAALESSLFSPDSQAQTELIVPASIASACPPGEFSNASMLDDRLALLEGICSLCPKDSFSPSPGRDLECSACPDGTSTQGEVGAFNCTRVEDNLLSNGMLSFGYVAIAVSWLMAFFFIGWVIVHRKDPVVSLAQIPYLLLICVGGIVSTSSIVGLLFQAGTGEDTDQATAGCKAAPILYSVGWVIQYGSLCSKTLRLSMIVESSTLGRRAKFSVWSSSYAIIVPLVVDAVILTAWTIINPLEYKREETGRNVEDGVVVVESVGRCRPSDDDVDVWAFLGPLLANHMVLVLITHFLLWKVRNVSNRYQENKYLSMAAIFALEVAIVGVPILIAAQDSVEATFFVITGIVALDNIGVLAFIFIPKVNFQIKGLEEGVTIGESVLSATHKKAVLRESSRRSGFSGLGPLSELSVKSSSLNDSSFRQLSFAEENNKDLLLPSFAEQSEEYSDSDFDVDASGRNEIGTPASSIPSIKESSEEHGHSDEIPKTSRTDPSTEDDTQEP